MPADGVLPQTSVLDLKRTPVDDESWSEHNKASWATYVANLLDALNLFGQCPH
jgi:hypothetical protein